MKFLIFSLIYFLLLNNYLYSQCGCTSIGGLTPIGGTANIGVMREGFLRTNLFYKYFYGDEDFREDSKVQKHNVEYYNTHYSVLSIGYGFSNDLTLESELGYFPQKFQKWSNIDLKSSGFSHVMGGIKYNVFNSIISEWELTLGSAVRLPLNFKSGDDQQYMRPSTGAYSLSLNSFLHKGFKNEGIHFFLISGVEYNFPDNNNHQYGLFIYNSIFATKTLTKNLSSFIEFRNEIRNKNKLNDKIIDDTGGIFLILSPQLNYSISNFNLSLIFDYPIYQYYFVYDYFNDFQLANNYSIGLNLTWQTKL